VLRFSFALLRGLSLALVACEGAPDSDVSAPPPFPTARIGPAVSGTYDVKGVTVQALTGRQREIGGTLELSVEGDRYEVSFELETTNPDVDEPAPVRVRGTGRGFVVGDLLTGTTEEWMGLAVPMEESRGVELPRNAGIRIVSSSQGSFEPDGSFHVLLQNQPGPGQDYVPSVTVLAGRRAGQRPRR
jgi:hypothetical protein